MFELILLLLCWYHLQVKKGQHLPDPALTTGIWNFLAEGCQKNQYIKEMGIINLEQGGFLAWQGLDYITVISGRSKYHIPKHSLRESGYFVID